MLVNVSGKAYAQSLSPGTRNLKIINGYNKQQTIKHPVNTISSSAIDQKNLKSVKQAPINDNRPQTSNSFLHKDLRQEKIEIKETLREYFKTNFLGYYQQFLQLDPDSFSITKAVYLSEAAFYNTPYSFTEFQKQIKQRADLVNQILTREDLNNQNNIALNYGIQKLYTDNNLYLNDKTHNSYVIGKLQYDFEDYAGDKNWEKTFVTKMLLTNSGQCHSMPLFYLCIAEQLNAKAYLSLAPNHSFIQFFDNNQKAYNFETTNGHLVSTAWLMQSTYANSVTLKNKTFLDTLSSRKLFAQCLTDLIMNYLKKLNGYDNFSNTMIQKALSIDSTNVTALILLNNYHRLKVIALAEQLGNPPLTDFERYPELNMAYQQQKKLDAQIRRTGYQEMPKEAYEKWLQSMQQARQQEQSRLAEAKLKQDIDKLKQVKPTIKNNQSH